MKQFTHSNTLHWGWLIPLCLMLMAIIGTRLDIDGLWYDEVFTVRNASGAGYQVDSVQAWYQSIQADDPYQAIGYPAVIALWGAVVGWSEFALRVSSLLFTVIALALTYRLGRDVTRSSDIGILSAMVFGFSTFIVHYSHELRAFTFVTIFATLLIWAYHRILTNPSRMAYGWLIIGGVGLLYAHYYSAMLLIALGIYHVLFVPKNRQWLAVPLCGVLMALAFIPQLPAFIEGFTRFDPANVEQTPMRADAVITSLLYYIGNGTNWLTSALMIMGIILIALQKTQMRMVIGIGLLATGILIASNEALDILEPTRLRYAIFLWSIYAVWIAYVLMVISTYLATLIRNTPAQYALLLLMPILWFANALFANFTVGFNESIEGTETPRLRTITNVIREEGTSSDIFAFYNGNSSQAWYIQDTLTYSVWDLPMPTLTTASLYDSNPSTRDWASEQIASTQRVWYGANRTFGMNNIHDEFLALMSDDFVRCETYVMRDDMSLALFARSDVYCDDDARITQFGGYTLTDYALIQTADSLSVQLGWTVDETITPDTYSVSVQLQARDGTIAQTQDLGIAYERFVPMQLTLDVRAIDADDYEVLLVVYAWQTGERLRTETGDTYSLGSIRIE